MSPATEAMTETCLSRQKYGIDDEGIEANETAKETGFRVNPYQ